MKVFEFTDPASDIDFSLIYGACSLKSGGELGHEPQVHDIIYFDLETTGLDADRSDLYIIGLSYINESMIHTVLLFNDDGNSEAEMLSSFNSYLEGKKYLVSYNGDTFDIPYLSAKYHSNQIDVAIFDSLNSIDIYRHIRPYKKYLHTDSMKQKDIEQLMGIHRASFISGGELISKYRQYLISGDKKLLDMLIAHNYDDLKGLTGITDVLAVYELFHGGYTITSSHMDETCLTLTLGDIRLPFRINYANEYMSINGRDDDIHVYIPIYKGELKYYFKDYKNYYYLTKEDIAIHKSMALYVDKNFREKATRENAYTKKKSIFIRQGSFQAEYIYKSDISSKKSYIELDEQLANDREQLRYYLMDIMKRA